MIVEFLIAVVHLTFGGLWCGSMAYSLVVVQPKIARLFSDVREREELLLTLAQGNRWPVAALIAVLVLTGLVLGLTGQPSYGVSVVLYLTAAGFFVNVSWRHWPRRVFALPTELPGYQSRLRTQAWIMLTLAGAAFLVSASTTVAAGLA